MSFIAKKLNKLAMKASGLSDEEIALAENQQKTMEDAYKRGGSSAAREAYFKNIGMNEEEIMDVENQQKTIEDAYKKGGDSAAREAYYQNAQKTMDRVTGNVREKETVCPQCGKSSGGGKFCNNCGASLAPKKCLKCGTENSVSTKFCGECGTKLI